MVQVANLFGLISDIFIFSETLQLLPVKRLS